NDWVFRSNRQEPNGIAESHCYGISPGLKFGTCPLEAMVFVSHLASRQRLEFHVVLDIRCCHHCSLRACEFKEDSLKGRKTRRILVLDDFHHSGGVVASETFVAIGQRSVNQTNSLL